MKKYEYKFVEVSKKTLKKQKGDTFKECHLLSGQKIIK